MPRGPHGAWENLVVYPKHGGHEAERLPVGTAAINANHSPECVHCGIRGAFFSLTKVWAHVAGVAGHEIKVCAGPTRGPGETDAALEGRRTVYAAAKAKCAGELAADQVIKKKGADARKRKAENAPAPEPGPAQRSLADCGVSTSTPERKEELSNTIAMWVYQSGVSFNAADNPLLRKAMGLAAGLGPSFKASDLPTRKELAGRKLKETHAMVKKATDEKFELFNREVRKGDVVLLPIA